MKAGRSAARPAAALLVLLLGLVLPLLIGGPVAGAAVAAAGAPAAPADPTAPAGTATAGASGTAIADPQYPEAGRITASIDSISPTVVTKDTGSVLTVTGVITNSTAGPVYDLQYVFQRGDPLSGVAAIRSEIARPSRPDAVVGQDYRVLGTTAAATAEVDMAPGTSRRFVATVPIGSRDGLNITGRGVYPLMIKVKGDIGTGGRIDYTRVGEFHLLTTVLSVASSTGGQADPGAPGAGFAVNLVWPIVATPHVGVSGIFLDDNLTKEISPGGRLYRVLTGLGQVDPGPRATTVVVDPELLAELQQMAAGYRVIAARGRAQSPLTPTTPTSPTGTPAGSTPVPSTGPASSAATSSAPTSSAATSSANTSAAMSTATTSAATSTPTTSAAPSTTAPSTAAGPTGTPPAGQPVRPTTLPATLPATLPRSTPTRPTPGTTRPAATPTRATPPTPTTSATPTPTPTASPTPSPTPTVSPTPSPTPTPSTPSSTAPPLLAPLDDTVAGAGQAAAISYLTALRTAVVGRQVLVLPYSDPDAVAMVRAGLTRRLGELVTKGRAVAADVLALAPATGPDSPGLITTMAMPEGGAVDDATLAVLSNNGMTQALLAGQSVRHSGSATGAVTVDERGSGGRSVAAAVIDSPLLAAVNNLINKGTSAGLAVRLNTVAALLAGSSIDGSGTALIIAPDNRWTPNVAGLQTLNRLLAQLEAGSAVAGTPLPVIAGSATTPALLSYPEKSAGAELDPGYLAAVGRTAGALAGIRSSLAQAKGQLTPDPLQVLTPLSAALLTTTSCGLRTDRRNGQRILQTVDSTLGQLREKVTISSGTSYTLAGSTSPLLISVRNDLPYVVTVRVVIRDGQAVGMTATDPGPLSIPAGQSRQFKIATKVVKAGRFQIGAQLVTATGANWSDPTTITVRSSAYGTITIILIVVAGGALFLMVLIRIVQRIRGRRTDTRGNPPGPRTSTPDPHNTDPHNTDPQMTDRQNAPGSSGDSAGTAADDREGTP